jgi:hypothetical protein
MPVPWWAIGNHLIPERDVSSHRILVRPVPTREDVIDDHHLGGFGTVLSGKGPAAQKRHMERLEVSRADHAVLHGEVLLFRRQEESLDLPYAGLVPSPGGQGRDHGALREPDGPVCYTPAVPIVCVFLGIVVRLFHDDHPPPHMHVEYGEYAGVIEIATGRLLGGRLSPRVRRLVEEWRRARRNELDRGWLEAQAGKAPRRIRPLD